MTEVIVVRHGETAWNVEGRIQGWRESELNARGWAQVAALGKLFAARGEERKVEAVYSSDLRRAVDTAAAVAGAVGLEVVRERRLREWHLGVMEGMLLSEAREREPEAARIYDERLVDAVVPGGESARQRYERSTACLEAIAERHAGGCVVVVTHGGILDDVYRYCNGIGLEEERDWDLFNCGVNRLRMDNRISRIEGRWCVEGWGEVGHLEGIGSMRDWNQGQVTDDK